MSEPENLPQLLRHPIRFYVDSVHEWLAHRRGAGLLQQTVIFYAYATFLLMLGATLLALPIAMFSSSGHNKGSTVETIGVGFFAVVLGATAGLSASFFFMLNPVARYAMRLEASKRMASKSYARCQWVFVHQGWWFAIFMLVGGALSTYFIMR
jgi:hypothetical protein